MVVDAAAITERSVFDAVKVAAPDVDGNTMKVIVLAVNVAPVVLPLFLKVVVDICNQEDEPVASLITDLKVSIGGISKFEPVPPVNDTVFNEKDAPWVLAHAPIDVQFGDPVPNAAILYILPAVPVVNVVVLPW